MKHQTATNKPPKGYQMVQTTGKTVKAPKGSQRETKGQPSAPAISTPPTVNTGGGSNQEAAGGREPSGDKRCRINVTLSPGTYLALRGVAGVTGKDLASVAAAAIEDGLNAQASKAQAIAAMSKVAKA